MIGTTIAGRYKIEEQIGIGGMGVVYRAEDETLRREIALKVIAPHLMQQEEARARFRREGQAVAGLTHPNIVTVYDLVEDKDSNTVCLIMELLQGASLRQRMADINRPAFSDVAIQMCRALEAAHGKSILHRDIKPENIFVGNDGTLKLMDFGLARLLGATSNTQTSMVAGTVSYMAPELLRGEKLDERADLYSLGVLLYEYLSGATPFAADNPGTVLLKHLNEAPPPLRERLPTLPVEIENIVMRLLAKDPNMRYASAAALRSALENPTPSGTTTQVELANTFATLPKLPPPAFVKPIASDSADPAQSASAIPFAPSGSKGPIFVSAKHEKPRSPAVWAGLGALLLLIGGGSFAAYKMGQRPTDSNLTVASQKGSKKSPEKQITHGAAPARNAKDENNSNRTPDEIAQLSRSVKRTQAELDKERRERERLQKALDARQNTPAVGPDVPPPVVVEEPKPAPLENPVTPQNPTTPAPVPQKPALNINGTATFMPRNGNIVRVRLHFNTDCNVRFYSIQTDEGQAVSLASSSDRLGVSESGQGNAPIDLTLLSGVPPLIVMVASTHDLASLPPSYRLPSGVQKADVPAYITQAPGILQYFKQKVAGQRGKKNGRETVVRLLQVRGRK